MEAPSQSRSLYLQSGLVCFDLGYIHTGQESFSLHFRDRRGADSHRFRNGAEITALMCEQKPYPVGFSYRRKSYPVQCKPRKVGEGGRGTPL